MLPSHPRLLTLPGFQEGHTSVVNISAPDNIDHLLEFLYTGAVDLSECEDVQVMTTANELAVLGDFYQVGELRTYAERVLGHYLGEYNPINTARTGSDQTCPNGPAAPNPTQLYVTW